MQQMLLNAKRQLTPAEAASVLGVAPVTVRSWAQKGWLHAEITAGGHRRFSGAELLRFARERGLTLHWSDEQKSRILVVDDDVQLSLYLTELLESISPNIEVVVAQDGFDAGVQLMKFKPDVVLLDLMMPGLDGFSVCKNIKSDPLTNSIQVIAMTGYATPENIERVLALGAEVCLSKPFDKDILLQALNLDAEASGPLTGRQSLSSADNG